MTNEKILLQLEKGYDIKNPQLAQVLKNTDDKIRVTKAELEEAIETKANLVGGKVPAEELPSYVDDVIEFNGLLDPSTRISIIVGNSSNKNRTYFISGSNPNSGRVGSSDKYPYMFVNFGENTSEEDWISETPERGKIYLNISNDHSYRWTGSELLDLDKNWSTAIVGLSQNTIRTDTSQDFSNEAQNTGTTNLGLNFAIIPKQYVGASLSGYLTTNVRKANILIIEDLYPEKPSIYWYVGHVGVERVFQSIKDSKIYSISFRDDASKYLSSVKEEDILKDVVKTTSQTFTDAKKQQARTNIGAASSNDVYNKYKEHGGSKMSESLMYDELAAQLTETTVLIDSIQLDTILDQSLGNKVHSASTILLLNKGEISHFFKGPNINSGYVTFYNLYSGDTATCVIRSLSYEINTRKLLNITTINISPKDYFDKIKDTNPTEDFDKVYKYLFNNAVIIDNSSLDTTITNTTTKANLEKASVLIITQTSTAPIVLEFSNYENSPYKVFSNVVDSNDEAIIVRKVVYNTSTGNLSNITKTTIKTPFAVYKSNGGTKYTTEAGFNAAFVAVMDAQTGA